MRTCGDCPCSIVPHDRRDEDYPSVFCLVWRESFEAHDKECKAGKLIRACHRQRDRARRAEKQFNDAAPFLAVHGWFGPMTFLPIKDLTEVE